MSLPIHVECYSGYRGEERPKSFELDDVDYEITELLDQWYEPMARYFKVRAAGGKIYLLRHDEHADEWTLQSGFDGAELLARPNTQIITIDENTLQRAEQEIASCEACNPEADLPFDWILSQVSGSDGAVEYVLSRPAVCPRCRGVVLEKTLVDAEGGIEVEGLNKR